MSARRRNDPAQAPQERDRFEHQLGALEPGDARRRRLLPSEPVPAAVLIPLSFPEGRTEVKLDLSGGSSWQPKIEPPKLPRPPAP
jgi:hypothetical protein